MTSSPQPPRTPHAPNTRSRDERDLPDHAKAARAHSDAYGALISVAARLLHLRSFEIGDPDDEALRLAAVEIIRIADTLPRSSRWPMEEIDG